MLLTIIIPVYNAEVFLRECLESVILEKGNEFEVILVNDGSQDGSLAICEEFANRDSRIRVISKPNEGVSIARNLGMNQANGTYLMFLDADDYFRPQALSVVLEDIKKKKDFLAYSYDTLYQNLTTKEERYEILGNETEEKEDILKILLTSSRFNTCWGKVYKASLVNQYHISFREGVKTGEDTLFVIEYLKYCQSFYVKNYSLLCYRQNDTSVMHQMDIFSKLKDFQTIYDERMRLSQTISNQAIINSMKREFFSVITDLLLQAAKVSSFRRCKKVYEEVMYLEMVKEIIDNAEDLQKLPHYKRFELFLLKKHHYFCLTSYFKQKATITKHL